MIKQSKPGQNYKLGLVTLVLHVLHEKHTFHSNNTPLKIWTENGFHYEATKQINIAIGRKHTTNMLPTIRG
jgi:hypothetical protein